ncbi:MAG: helix-turn-helix domain-containing protein [Planctomycetota bacterium]|nr:helix-turn-helix domain-containing protein [Planctomycetota bacterium]
MNHLSSKLVAYRKQKSWTQRELARALDISQPTVARLEHDEIHAASVDLLIAIARLLACAVADLVPTDRTPHARRESPRQSHADDPTVDPDTPESPATPDTPESPSTAEALQATATGQSPKLLAGPQDPGSLLPAIREKAGLPSFPGAGAGAGAGAGVGAGVGSRSPKIPLLLPGPTYKPTFIAFCPNWQCTRNQVGRNHAGQVGMGWTSQREHPTPDFDEIRFCTHCSTALLKECPHCHAKLASAGSPFCIRCGKQIFAWPTVKELEKAVEKMERMARSAM